MDSRTKLPASEEVEMSYNSHVRDIQRGHNTQADSGIHERDEREIRRMGKLSQYKRVHRGRTIFATSASIQASWQVSLASLTPGLLNGGTAGIFWSFIFTAIFALSNVFSIAEYTSIAPINGGQYHWVSEFAPRYKKPLSYLTGWWSTIAWQSTAAGATFLAGSFIPSLAALFYPDYVPTPWQNNLCVFALVLLILAINATSTKPLIYIQMIAMVVLFIGWLPVAGCLAGLAPHPPFSETVTNFTSSGWSNLGIAVLLIALNASYALTHACALWARLTGNYHPEIARFNLGRYGPVANVVALCYDLFLIVFLAFPPAPEIDATSLNWGPFIFIFTTLFAGIYYVAIGRKLYRDPSKDVVG
ncbi:hypothetical protein B0A48_18284 [Cryoendolithus antarcticus]|uniref:Amino acid permease/ SLC12A domain-containing protein n=1 Tax=Cryoendolithus antarcticus TaxID=1507870 RepID=A0A1V8S916_9PEZI|nr:hypothetical protein B0A48_18284 [Cryoendolithus antarcticus]